MDNQEGMFWCLVIGCVSGLGWGVAITLSILWG